MRDLMNNVSSFYNRIKLQILGMKDAHVKGRRRKVSQVSNLHHYQVDLFYIEIDMQLQKLNNCCNEINTELLLCVVCLSPRNSFSTFDKEKLLKIA